MFGVPDDAVYDPETLAQEEERRERDKHVIARVIFIALVLFAPGFYWLIVAVAWAPISYFVVLGIAYPSSILVSAVPVTIYATIYWWTARGLGSVIQLSEHRWRRLSMAAGVVIGLGVYSLLARYQPIHGYDAPNLNIIRLIMHAFGPQLNGVC